MLPPPHAGLFFRIIFFQSLFCKVSFSVPLLLMPRVTQTLSSHPALFSFSPTFSQSIQLSFGHASYREVSLLSSD